MNTAAKLKITVVAVLLAFAFGGAIAQTLKPSLSSYIQFGIKPLYGMDVATFPTLSFEEFLQGKMQRKVEEWINTNCGGRNFLVRLHNEILYSVFGCTGESSGNIILGANRIPLMRPLTETHYHEMTDEEIASCDHFAAKLAEAQALAAKRRIAFVYVVTPDKCRVYPEYLPAALVPVAKHRRYEQLVQSLQKWKVNYVDGVAITQAVRKRGEVHAFAKTGVHWTEPAAAYTYNAVIDSINKQIGSNYSPVVFDNLKLSTATHIDVDGRDLMNTLIQRNALVENGTVRQYVPTPPKGQCSWEGGSFGQTLADIARKASTFDKNYFYFYYTKGFYYTHAGVQVPGMDQIKPVNKWWIDWGEHFLTSNAIVVEKNEAQSYEEAEEFLSDLIWAFNSYYAAKTGAQT